MAFLSKVRGVLKHTTAKNMMGGELSVSTPAIFQAFRCMSSKIFVGGLSYQTTEDILQQKCEQYGVVHEVRIIHDRETGNSRGFGFVTFESDEAAKSAIMALDNQDLDGRRLKVNQAHDRAAGGGGGGRGYNNFGGGGGYNNFGGGGYQGGGGYNQGGGGGYNQGGGGGYNPGGGGYNQGGGGYDTQAYGGYNAPSTDFGGSNAFEAGNGVPAGGDNFNVGSVENSPGVSYGGGDQVNTANSDFPLDGEDGQQERRAS